nr:DNA replication and repair protein RecF [Aminivibrio sp.]
LDDWWKSLETWSERERRSCLSLVGPHRDDLMVRTGGREAAAFFSRGQIRRASVALMLAAGKAVEARLRRKPLILLDEIASELDREGRKITMASLAGTGWQVVAAAAEMTADEWPGSMWKVEEGAVLPCR